jgi:hypothetical protein
VLVWLWLIATTALSLAASCWCRLTGSRNVRWYGLGLAERRYGNFLHNKERSEYVLSTKVGKLLKASKTAKNKEYFPFSPSPNDVI